MENARVSDRKNQNPASASASKAPAPAPLRSPPPLFRRIDWLTLAITFLFVFVGYCLTLAPELTLEDSGELATGAFYAGIPHPPGYPVWTVYSWIWTVLLPFKNVAWRVALGSAFAGAVASGLLAFVVSRGSSMIIESIDDLKGIDRRLESAICMVSGFVAGMLIGFNGYMWSQSVIVEVYPLSVASLMGVVLCLLRWIYAPHQHRYLYWAFFLYGICFNNHQSLLVIAMGMEALVIAAEPKLGREMLFWNTILYLAGTFAGPAILTGNTSVFVIFNIIGIISAVLWIWLVIKTKKPAIEFGRDLSLLGTLGCAAMLFLGITDYAPGLNDARKLIVVFTALLGMAVLFGWLIKRTAKSPKEWLVALGCGGSWLFGAAFYFYEPLAGMTDPPMQWAYPRTVEGFVHAITRGQYERIHPTSGTGDNMFAVIHSFLATYGMQLWRFLEGLNDEINILYLLIALVVFLFYRKMKKRERTWIIGMVALFICLGPFLVLLLNFSSDRQSLELCRVFLTSSHVFVAMSVGYGLTLLAASMSAHYNSLRKVSLLGGICAVDFSLFILAANSQLLFKPEMADMVSIYGFAKITCWLAALVCLVVIWRKGLEHDRLLAFGIPGFCILASLVMTLLTVLGDPPRLAGVGEVFQAIGQSFNPHQYGLPVYAALILVAAGLVFLGAVWLLRTKPPLAITLAVFAILPSYSIMTHWFDNEQRNHWFGYWFGHDMFTPPFVAPDGKLSYDPDLREKEMAGPNGKLIYPEMARDAILFGGTDPGRFCPTYMIFCDSFIPHKDQPVFDQKFDRRDVYIITQNALADGTYLQYIRAQYFRSAEHDPPFFQELLRGPEERNDNYSTNFLAKIAGKLLDTPFEALGARIEARRRRDCVYPPKEIYTPSNEDSQRCFQEYITDASARLARHQLRPGEGVKYDTNTGRVQVSGQVAVMAINGLLTKVIFDHNPESEFYVEESFPLDWMYPHLTPYGIIMKINRKPVPEITEGMIKRDHEFWSEYSRRLIGNWITYDTSVKQIVDFVERVYLHHNYAGFKGDLKFVRDDQAQKAFSKLRSSIAGIYAWRLGLTSGAPVPAKYLAPPNSPERQRIIKEADFAFRQAFAFCPYSPEAVFRYVNFLMNQGRPDDAVLVAETCRKLDPDNGQIVDLVDRLKNLRNPSVTQIQDQVAQLEADVRANPNDFQKAFDLFSRYLQLKQRDKAVGVLQNVLNNPHAPANAVLAVAQAYASIGDLNRLETALQKLVKIAPTEPEAWYNLAAAESVLGKQTEAIQSLQKSLNFNAQRLARDPKAHDLRTELEKDQRFQNLRTNPAFKHLLPPP